MAAVQGTVHPSIISEWEWKWAFNPFLTSGLVHPYHLDESVSNIGVSFFTVCCIEISVSKQYRF